MLIKREPGRPFLRRTVHNQILHEVGERILRGEFMPGDILPSENALSDEFKVSRPVMREAIKVLAAKGLVDPRPKIGTRVRGREQWNMLDPDIMTWSFASREAEQYAIHLSEMRRVLEPEAAALAALRASPAQVAQIASSYAGMEASPEDTQEHFVHDLRFHQGVLEATGNPFIASTGHVIESALLFSFKLASQIEGARTDRCRATARFCGRSRSAMPVPPARRCSCCSMRRGALSRSSCRSATRHSARRRRRDCWVEDFFRTGAVISPVMVPGRNR
ncbi:MAG: FadR family transcriptional regulator [Rhodospirillaceae bacterium]|nr:FadR family transcriptional regulator [Rhodospirillaceae bacterium]